MNNSLKMLDFTIPALTAQSMTLPISLVNIGDKARYNASMKIRMWILLIALTSIAPLPTTDASATSAYRAVPRSYSGGVFLAHKRFVKKAPLRSSRSSQR